MVHAKLNSYSDVFKLGENELRALLTSGDEPVQVWASWALGIKLNEAQFPSNIKSLISAEPSPGVRQNLLVFLAGNGDYDLLETYARTDPHTEVRAAACNLIARVAINIKERNNLLEEILVADSSKDVQLTILKGAVRDHRPIALEVIRKIIVSENQTLQTTALDVVVASQYGKSDVPTELLIEIYSWANHIHPDVYAKYCTFSYELAGGEHVFKLSKIRSKLLSIPLDILLINNYKTTWRNLDRLVNLVGMRNFPRILDLLNDDFDHDTTKWLLEIMATDIAEHNEINNIGHYSEVCRIAKPKLYSMLLKSITPSKTKYAIPVLKQLRMDLSYAQSPDPDDTWDYGDNTALIEHYKDFIARLEPWS